MDYLHELEQLLAKHSFREKPEITLPSGDKSSVYINCKRTVFSPKGQFVVGKIMLDYLQQYNAHMIAGPIEGAIPIICATLQAAWYDKYPLFGCFTKRMKDGKLFLEGVFSNKVDNAIIVEDVITNGESVANTINLLEERGTNVKAVIALVDRSSGKLAFKHNNYIPLFSVDRLKSTRSKMDLRPKDER